MDASAHTAAEEIQGPARAFTHVGTDVSGSAMPDADRAQCVTTTLSQAALFSWFAAPRDEFRCRWTFDEMRWAVLDKET